MAINIIIAIVILLLSVNIILNNIIEGGQYTNNYSFVNRACTDSLKGFAIVMIAIAHICQYDVSLKKTLIGGSISYSLLFSWGAIGVSLFFLLSGYGCYLSISRQDNYRGWIVKHVLKMLIHFICAFILVISVNIALFGAKYDYKDLFINIVTLRLPGSTVWYFKIQILFYIILTISMTISRKNASIIVLAMSLIYAIIANYCFNLPDYWWKTALCFPFGCMGGQYKNKAVRFTTRILVKICIIFVGCIAYILIMKDNHYRIALQLLGYVYISVCITVFWDWVFNQGSRIFGIMGKASLDLYLIHIGYVEIVLSLNYNKDLLIVLFMCLTGVTTFLCYHLSELINKRAEDCLLS